MTYCRVFSRHLFRYYPRYKHIYEQHKCMWLELLREDASRFRYKVLNNNRYKESIKQMIYLHKTLKYESNYMEHNTLLSVLDDKKYISIFGIGDESDQRFQYLFIIMFENINNIFADHKNQLRIQTLKVWHKNKYAKNLPVEIANKILNYL